MKKLLPILAVILFSCLSSAQEMVLADLICVDDIWYEIEPLVGGDNLWTARVVGIHTMEYDDIDIPKGMEEYEGNIVIPPTITYEGESYPVEEIAPHAFEGTVELEIIEDDWYPEFYEIPVSNLTSVTLPSTIQRIGEYAFAYCCKLTSIKIPGFVEIGEGAFELCNNLKSVQTDDIKDWLSITFWDYSSNPLCQGGDLYVKGQKVTDLVIPDDAWGIYDYAFYGCSSLTSVSIPNSISDIGEEAFSGCANLATVELHCSTIGTWFAGYPIKNLILGNEVMSIGNGAFFGCDKLSTVTIPNSATSIGTSAFENCSGLTAVTLSSKLSEIGDKAFYGCRNIKEVTALCKRPTPITANVFPYRTTQKLYVPQGCTSVYEAADYWWQFMDIIEKGSSDLKGDMNDDGVLTITDAVIIIDKILGNQ